MYIRCEYLNHEKEKAKKKTLSDEYMEKQLLLIEGTLRCIQAEINRIERAEIEHEMVFVETSPGKFKLYDFMTGRARDVQALTQDEFKEYVNRRAGFKIY